MKVERKNKIFLAITLPLILGIPLFLVSLFVFTFILEPINNPIAARYFALNAAVKNTCYLDPQREHCPRSLKELISIEPQKFEPLLSGKTASYFYWPKTNEYTLIVRHDRWRGVVFDPKFEDLGTYDFMDLAYLCGDGNPEPLIYGSGFTKQSWKQYLNERGQLTF